MGKQQDYISRVYTALKENLEGFNKDEPTFRKQMADSAYAQKVYTALSDNLEGFNKTQDDFFVEVGVKKKDLSQSGSPSGFAPSQSIKPGTSVFPQQALGSQQFEPMPVEQRYKADPIPEGGFKEFSKYLYNKSVEGVGNAVTGAADFGIAAGSNLIGGSQLGDIKLEGFRKTVAPEIKGVVGKAKVGQSKAEEKRYDERFITRALGGLASSVPAMATPGGVALFAQGYDAGLNLINNTKYADQLSESEKSMFGSGVGLVSAMLEKTGLDEILKGSKGANEFAESVTIKVLDDLFENGVPVTVKNFSTAASKIVTNTARGSAIEGVTGGLQEAGSIAAEKVFNKYKGKPIFEEQSWGEMLGRVAKAAGEEAVGGGVIGGVVSAATDTYDAVTAKKAVATNQPEVVDIIQQKLDEQLQSGAMPQEEYDAMQEYIAQTKDINSKIPERFTGEVREKIIDVTSDRNILLAQQAMLEQEASMADAAFKPRYDKQIADLQDQINAHNDAILGLESPIIYRQTEKGFEKVDGTRVEEITEEQFNYAKDNKLEGIEVEGSGAVAEPTSAVAEEGGALTEEQQPTQEEVEDGLVVYHGSPYAYEQFDLAKIGSGEGAQAFGYGLYFTNKKEIAESYANNLSTRKKFWEHLMAGNDISLSKDDFDFIDKELDALGYDGERAEAEGLSEIIVEGKPVAGSNVLEALAVLFGKNSKASLQDYGLTESEINRLMDIKKKISDPQLYKVRLHTGKKNSEFDYLDWDNDLTESQRNKIADADVPSNIINGKDVYKFLSEKLGGDKQASEYLLSKGIDGIAYKSSKGTGGKDGKGINYVVFDPRAISIEELNEQVLIDRSTPNATQESSQQIPQGGEQGNQLQREGVEAEQNQTPTQTDSGDSNIAGEEREIENSTGTYSFEVINTLNGPEKRYYRKEPNAILQKTEISEEEYNLNTGVTPVYDAEGNVDLTVIKNTPETGLTDEQFEAVKEKYYAKVSNGGSPGQAAQSAMTAARSYVGNRILTAAQYQAIKKALLPIASQYTGAVRKMQNPNLAEVQEQKDTLRKAFAERVLGWMDKLKAFAIDDEQRVLSAIRKNLGKGAKIAEAAFKNINRYSSKASQVIKEANNDIFKGLSKKLDYTFEGKKFSAAELFSYLIQMDRIKNINQMMKDKFDRFEVLRKKKDRTDEENKELKEIKKYLSDRRVLRSVAGGFELLPYEAGHSIDNEGADKNIEDIKKLVGNEMFSDFENRRKMYADVYRLLLEEQLQAGIIDQAQYDAMAKYDYAPTMHLDKLIDTELKSSRNAGGKVKSGSGLSSLKGGSESALSDAYDVQLIFDINSTFKRVFANRAARKLYEAARANPDNGLVELATPIIDPVTKMPKFDSKGNFRYPKAPSGYDYIPVFIDGSEYKLIAPAEFADMYKSGSAKLPKDIDNVVNFLATITGVTFTRNLITGINPAFGVYQTVMDMPQAVIATDAFSPSFTVSMVQLGKQMGSVAKDVATRSGWFTKAEDYGALQDMTTSEKNKIGDEVNWMGKRKGVDNSLLSQTIRKGEEFNQKFEHLTRVAVFKAMWEKLSKENPNMSQEDIGILAAAEAGKVVDYSRGGVFSKFMSKFLPYFNARIQVFRSSASGYKNNPTKLGVHSLELMAFTSLALAYTIGVADDDDEMLDEYLRQPQDTRNKFVLIRNKFSDDPDKMYIKLPIPAILIPIKVLFEESLLDALGKKDFNFENAADAFKELSPVDKAAFTSNPMMSAFIKYAYNKDMYYNRDIVQNETEKFDWTEGQNNPKIEEMYKQLGQLSNKIGFKEGISPERAKAAVESFGLRANKNPFVSIPFGALDATLAYASGNEDEVKKRVGDDVGEWLYKNSGIPSRVFASQAQIDAEFKELKADMTKEATLKREENKKAYREAFEEGGEKALRKLLKDVDNEEDIVKTLKNEKLLEDRPSWYKELVYAPSNAEKVVVINYYLRNATSAKKKEVIKDLKKNFISSESEVWDEIVD